MRSTSVLLFAVLAPLLAACGGGGDGGGTGTVTVDTVVVSPPNPSVVAGGTVQLSAQAREEDGTVINGRTFSWASLSTGVATVNATSGLVTGVSAGTAVVTATTGSVTGRVTVTITAPPAAASITLTPPVPDSLFAAGATQQLTAVVKDQNNNVMNGVAITWSSNNTAAATVSQTGLVTAGAVGNTAASATITATVTGTAVSTTVPIAVRQKLATIAVTPKPITFFPNDAQQLTSLAKDSRGATITGLGGFTFGSTNNAVATVSGAGLVTGAGAGTAKIGVSLVRDGVTATDTVNVTVNAITNAATVTTPGLSFNPATVHILANGTVTWNLDATHGVDFLTTAPPGGDTPTCGAGVCQEQRTFPTAGTYNYQCTFHGAAMSATVIVH